MIVGYCTTHVLPTVCCRLSVRLCLCLPLWRSTAHSHPTHARVTHDAAIISRSWSFDLDHTLFHPAAASWSSTASLVSERSHCCISQLRHRPISPTAICTPRRLLLPHRRPPIPALTGLRAALMLHVLIRNMHYSGADDIIGWMVDGGAVGVATFFCLSCFILAYCYGNHRFHTWRCYFSFIGRRYARLLPIYYISQLMCLGDQVNAVRQYGWDGWTVLHWLALATGTQFWFYWPAYELTPRSQYRGLSVLNRTLWAISAVLFFYVSMPVLMRVIRWYIGVDRLNDLPRGHSTSPFCCSCKYSSIYVCRTLG